MDTVSLAHAKEHLEQLIEKAARGEDVQIIDPRHGTVRLTTAVSGAKAQTVRIPGRWKGKIHIPDEALLAPLSEDELAWLSGETSQ